MRRTSEIEQYRRECGLLDRFDAPNLVSHRPNSDSTRALAEYLTPQPERCRVMEALHKVFSVTARVVDLWKRKKTGSPASGSRVMSSRQPHPILELLESRELLSTTSVATTDLVYDRSTSVTLASTSSTVQGYTPSQIAHAYGFDQVKFSSGTVKGDGSGQTIAIVDAFNDPNITADLKVFDQQFGLADASLEVVSQTGSSSLPSTNAGWAGEISLDVEWAHAMAPGAKILLVEATSDSTSDLMTAVDYARKAAGVSVVSMSWGGSEFVSYTGGESTSQLTLDSTFTTPSGHTGVTFVASAGDSGFANGVQWPASSPNVLSVGGTSLVTSDNIGTYQSEGPWRGFSDGTSGGFSQVESEPAYQETAQQTGARSTPDVGYNADPQTGFAVYDSLAYQGASGWQEVGGTSAGAPQWAALIAIADQGRAINGQGTLDGPNQTMAALYSVYSAPNTTGYTSYTSVFNDIGSDGYGYSTGLGSPKVAAVVETLTEGGATTSPTPAPTPTPTPAPTLPASPLSLTYVSTLPVGAVGGTRGTVKVRLTNVSGTEFSGPVRVDIYASSDGTMSSDDMLVGTVTVKSLKLGIGGTKVITLKLTYSSSLPEGSYYMVAAATATSTNTAAAQVASKAPVSVTPPTVDLATMFSSTTPITVTPGRSSVASVTITNTGDVTAKGTFGLSLYASTDQTLDVGDELLAALTGRKLNLKAGHSLTLRVHFSAPKNAAGGTYYLIAATSSSTNPSDSNANNDDTTIATA